MVLTYTLLFMTFIMNKYIFQIFTSVNDTYWYNLTEKQDKTINLPMT